MNDERKRPPVPVAWFPIPDQTYDLGDGPDDDHEDIPVLEMDEDDYNRAQAEYISALRAKEADRLWALDFDDALEGVAALFQEE